MNDKRPIDPFTRHKVPIEGEFMPAVRDRNLPGVEPTYLDKLRLNLVVALGSPFRVKYDLVERALAILHFIELDPVKLTSPGWIIIYKDLWNSTQRELEKLDIVWKDLQTKRASHEQLRAFTNMEIFMDFISYLSEILQSSPNLTNGELDSDILIGHFVEFLKDKNMFI